MPDRDFFCKRPWIGFEIEHDGTVKPCCMSKEMSCGNINHSSIEEIWNGEKYRTLRQLMATGQWEKVCRPECPRLHDWFEDATPDAQSEPFAGNYELSENEIRERLTVLRSKPRFWKLTHSTRCNIDCIMCYQDRNDLRELPEKFYTDLLEYQPSIQELELIGGETLAIKRFRQFLQFFAESGEFPDLRFSFVTNGTVHDDKTLDLIRKLAVSWISISVDAATFPTYATIRRGGDFNHTCTGIERLTALGRERGIPVLLSFTVMKDNVLEVADFVRLGRKYGVDILFGKITGTKGGQNNIDRDVLRSSLNEAITLASSFRTEMRFANMTLLSLLSTIDQ
jgi:radical SAM protein with 4Fe4S-binding SPASM domain